MALCDYRLCDRCGGKAFYDANLNYGDPGATCVRGQHYTLDHVGDWAVLCQTCAETHAVVIMSHETGTPRLEDGWRRCAVGQRTTQSCGMAEEARAQERQRIVERVCVLRDQWLARWNSPIRMEFDVPDLSYDRGRLAALRDVRDIILGRIDPMNDEPVLARSHGGACRVGTQIGREEGRKEERARIVALIHEQIAHWESEPVLRHWEDSADESDEVTALKRLLRHVEDTSHE